MALPIIITAQNNNTIDDMPVEHVMERNNIINTAGFEKVNQAKDKRSIFCKNNLFSI